MIYQIVDGAQRQNDHIDVAAAAAAATTTTITTTKEVNNFVI